MIGLCLGNGRKPTSKEKKEAEEKKAKTTKSSQNLFAVKSQKAMEKVVSYFETFFQSDENGDNAEEIESRRSHLSNLSGSLPPQKQKMAIQQKSSDFILPTPTSSGNNSYKSSDSLLENLITWNEQEWQTILAVNDLSHTPHLELCASLRSGIPEDLRPRIWFFLCKIHELKKSHAEKIYYRLKTSKSNADVDINKDIPRTFPDNPFFQDNKVNQQKLFNILRAYANYDSVLGYTQGMNYVVATMLLVLNPANYDDSEYSFGSKVFSDEEYEEKIFWMLIFVNYHKNWRDLYKDGMVKTLDLLSFFKKKMRQEVPEIYEHILGQGLDLQMCFDHAFITILLYYTPLDFSKRILDIFFLKGEHIIFDILIRIMKISKQELLGYNSTEELFNYLRKDMIGKCFENFKKSGIDYVKLLVPLRPVETTKFD